ncbi:MAG: hypothetical protein HY744_02330 [Deltaproteobacteria bacterium]|nr:hypothetical protein [Deltaproteobacteria bacterium]
MRRPSLAVRLAFALLAALVLGPARVAAAPPPMSRDDIICRAKSGVGFSYYWGGACWCANGCSPKLSCGAGSCSGSCPNCSHSGKYGADCSGFVTKVWQVPDAIAVTTCGHGPYVANSYRSSTSSWKVISRSSAEKGDAFASTHHVLIFESGNPWGQMWTYEARGCSYGIVHNVRTCSNDYSAARRSNLTGSCACAPGQTAKEECGNCGTHKRACGSDCQWGAWSSCSGQGSCGPGAADTDPCGDCGTRTRKCSSGCEWGAWSSCSGQGPCSPGEVETGACGNCGTHTRSCGANCHWGAWSSCAGQGPCGPGETQAEDCCDCGKKSRICSNQCAWGEWGGCQGPDPQGGDGPCETGEPGPCAVGRIRCLQGCLSCASDYEPAAEQCDAVDNDCSGEVDDGEPAVMGSPQPLFAARLADASYPALLAAGAVGEIWALFTNAGSETWRRGEIWLAAMSARDLKTSRLYDPESWPAWDVAAVLDRDVAPGETASFVWRVRAPARGGENVRERFRLTDPDGAPLRCPAPEVVLDVRIGAGSAEAPAGSPLPGGPAGGCGCRVGPHGALRGLWLLVALALAAARHKGRTAGIRGASWLW